jgi:hypothetical protein
MLYIHSILYNTISHININSLHATHEFKIDAVRFTTQKQVNQRNQRYATMKQYLMWLRDIGLSVCACVAQAVWNATHDDARSLL